MRNLILFFAVFVVPNLAYGEIYNCDIERRSRGDWIPTRLLIEHEKGEKTADVWDPFIKYFVGKPLVAEAAFENEKRVSIIWGITRLTNTHGPVRQYTPELKFRAVLLKPTLKLVIRSVARGYTNSFRGVGQCKIHK